MSLYHTVGPSPPRIGNKRPVGWGSADVKMPILSHCSRWVVLNRKVGQIDLVFDMQSGFISRSVCVCARLQVSCVQQLWFVAAWLPSRQTHTDRQTSLYEKLSSTMLQVRYQSRPSSVHVVVLLGLLCSDVNKDLTVKAKDRTKDWNVVLKDNQGPRPRTTSLLLFVFHTRHYCQ